MWGPGSGLCLNTLICCIFRSVRCGEATHSLPISTVPVLRVLNVSELTSQFSLLTVSPPWLEVTFSPSALSFSLLLFVQRRGPPKNHHNNRRSGSRLAVQFLCAPSLHPYFPLHAGKRFPSLSFQVSICAFSSWRLFLLFRNCFGWCYSGQTTWWGHEWPLSVLCWCPSTHLS